MVPNNDAVVFAKHQGLFLETSALSGENVESAFLNSLLSVDTSLSRMTQALTKTNLSTRSKTTLPGFALFSFS
ncbi:ras-related protein RABA3 [Spatholobus suberectus]|nr:ras-related protein RABA3 [Spatholobus suberectus]